MKAALVGIGGGTLLSLMVMTTTQPHASTGATICIVVIVFLCGYIAAQQII